MRWGIGTKLLAAFLLVVLVLGAVAYLFQRNLHGAAAGFSGVVQDLLGVVQLARAVARVDARMIRSGDQASPEAQREYMAERAAVAQARDSLPRAVADPADALLVANLRGMVDTFLAEADATMAAAARGDPAAAAHALEADRVAEYIQETVERLLAAELAAYSRLFPSLAAELRRAAQVGAALLAVVVAGAAAFTWWFTRGITRPLDALVAAAGRISRGDLQPIQLPPGAHGEVAALAQAVDRMLAGLRQALEAERLVRSAELRALQAQMDPHFLFNALNMVASTALLEGADRTCTLIEDIADLLRYNLRRLDEPVTLQDEVEHVRRYLHVQHQRFRDRLQYHIDADPAALDLPVPALVLQPLVENALVHGLAQREEGGQVRVTVRAVGDRIWIEVADDGCGMDPAVVSQVLSGQPLAAPRGSRSPGVGLANLRRRLELFYGATDLLAIRSAPGQGTVVTLSLPRGGAAGVPVAGGG